MPGGGSGKWSGFSVAAGNARMSGCRIVNNLSEGGGVAVRVEKGAVTDTLIAGNVLRRYAQAAPSVGERSSDVTDFSLVPFPGAPRMERCTVVSNTVDCTVPDDVIRRTIRECLESTGYQLDPHGACGYRALKDGLREGETGVFCETAHPAKFKDTVESITGKPLEIPAKLAAFMAGEKKSVGIPNSYEAFKGMLLENR